MSSSSANSRGWVSRSSGVPGGSNFSRRGTSDENAPKKQDGELRLGMFHALYNKVRQIDARSRESDHKDVGNNHHGNGQQRVQRDRTSRRDGDLFAHRVARHH